MRLHTRAVIAAVLLVSFAAIGWSAKRRRMQAVEAQTSSAGTKAPRRATQAAYRHAQRVGIVQNRRLTELSGLAVSRLRGDLLFAVNDSGDDPLLYALGADGRDRGTLRWPAPVNGIGRTWRRSCRRPPYLLIADVGDNLAWRSDVTLYVVPEPELEGERFAADAVVTPWRVLRVRYPGGAVDCEAVAVDAGSRQILLLSKREAPPIAYGVRLPASIDRPRAKETVLLARRLAQVPIPELSAHEPDLESPVSTSLDISDDGLRAVVITYQEAFFFERSPGESWTSALGRVPSRLRMPRMRAMEAVALAPDGVTIYASSEGSGAPLFRLDPPATP